ncbi:hypothetical protein BV25DRAFT_1914488 [Artomyces pyxidatus]|uniref:Uncharacterized protein n=1 Tax=Artomyces pyxidatus TaxID=48021 RepID=A0ACB8T6E5_9AGAM|nr:hypothetical protein BV25DRAFT_1914488 [Artomyces pyxidatus]
MVVDETTIATDGMPHSSLSSLPYVVLEHVLDYIDAPADVVTVSVLSSTFHDIAVPRHLRYREISTSLSDTHVWRHLAQRPDLAANVRKLVITRYRRADGWRSSPPPPPSYEQSQPRFGTDYIDVSTLLAAITNMTYLKVLELNTGLVCFEPHPMRIVSHILRSCLYLEKLDISHLLASPGLVPNTRVGTSDEALSIWSLQDFSPIMLPKAVYLPTPPVFNSLLSLSPNLQSLVLPARVGYHAVLAASFADCRFHNLRELTLNGWSHYLGHHIVQFLQAHPTLHLRVDAWLIVLLVFLPRNVAQSLESIDCREPLLLSLGKFAEEFLDIVRGRGSSVRRLSTLCPDIPTLRALAAVFPAVTHLHVRSPGLSTARTAGELLRQFVRAPRAALRQRQPRVEDALALFPDLEVLVGIEFKNSAEMRKLLACYPRLRNFENPRFCP